ncbi:hypothetical protein FRC09_004589 [Ceratobasidium sp. 395]|nr:hypothetical protein FRC09_004589 [Ceratobasidium sp. 395]
MHVEAEGVVDEAVNTTISSTMSAPAIIEILTRRGCRDLTGQLDLGRCDDRPVAGGGFGDIYRGVLLSGEEVAIKCARLYLQWDDIGGRKVLKRAARELDTWSHFEHENVHKLSGLAQFRGQMAMISPWMDQGTLLQHLKRSPAADRCQICIDISEGVAYLHRNDMIHGDIKGANVLISGEGVAKLTDFGCTKLKSSTLCYTTTTGGLEFSMRWAAPERLSGVISSKEVDVYALGMTLLEAVTGAVPFSDKDEVAVCVAVAVQRQLPERPKVFPSFSPDGANQLWGIVVDSCAYDSSDRPDCLAIRDRLQDIKKNLRQPSPDDMIIDSDLNADEYGRLWALRPSSDEIDDEYDEYGGDSDYDEYEGVDGDEEEMQSNMTWVERSEATRTPGVQPVRNSDPVYFFVSSTIYVFDRHRMVCRVDHNGRYHEVDLWPSPNPPGSESKFQIDNITYWFDRTNLLWYKLDGQWRAEKTYPNLMAARNKAVEPSVWTSNANADRETVWKKERNGRKQVVRRTGKNWPAFATTITYIPLRSSTLDDDYLYPPLSSCPSRGDIDAWFEEFKARRASLLKTRGRLGGIKCPLKECQKPQRRPQAFKDHLYIHFAYKCDFGCSIAFKSKSNKYQHMERCPYRHTRKYW